MERTDTIATQQQQMASEAQYRPCDTCLMPEQPKSLFGSDLVKAGRERDRTLSLNIPKLDLTFKPEVTE